MKLYPLVAERREYIIKTRGTMSGITAPYLSRNTARYITIASWCVHSSYLDSLSVATVSGSSFIFLECLIVALQGPPFLVATSTIRTRLKNLERTRLKNRCHRARDLELKSQKEQDKGKKETLRADSNPLALAPSP